MSDSLKVEPHVLSQKHFLVSSPYIGVSLGGGGVEPGVQCGKNLRVQNINWTLQGDGESTK